MPRDSCVGDGRSTPRVDGLCRPRQGHRRWPSPGLPFRIRRGRVDAPRTLFLKYFVSEAVAVGQSVGVVRHVRQPHTHVADFLLRRMSKTEAIKEEEAEKAEIAAAREATKLRIAWQYEKYAKSAEGRGPETGCPSWPPRARQGRRVVGVQGAVVP